MINNLYIKGTAAGGSDLNLDDTYVIPSAKVLGVLTTANNNTFDIPCGTDLKYLFRRGLPINNTFGNIITDTVAVTDAGTITRNVKISNTTNASSQVELFYTDNNAQSWTRTTLTSTTVANLPIYKLATNDSLATQRIFIIGGTNSTGLFLHTQHTLTSLTKVTMVAGIYYDIFIPNSGDGCMVGDASGTKKYLEVVMSGITVTDRSSYISGLTNLSNLRCVTSNGIVSGAGNRVVVGGDGAQTGTTMQCLAYLSGTTFSYCTISGLSSSASYKCVSLKYVKNVTYGGRYIAHIYDTSTNTSYILSSEDGITFYRLLTINDKGGCFSVLNVDNGGNVLVLSDVHIITGAGTYKYNYNLSGVTSESVTLLNRNTYNNGNFYSNNSNCGVFFQSAG